MVSISAHEFSCFCFSYSLPCPGGAGGEASKWLCGCSAADWGRPTTLLHLTLQASDILKFFILSKCNLWLAYGIGCVRSYIKFSEENNVVITKLSIMTFLKISARMCCTNATKDYSVTKAFRTRKEKNNI